MYPFVYVSRSQKDTLFEAARHRISSDRDLSCGFDFRVLNSSLENAASAADAGQLALIVRYLIGRGEIGLPDSEQSYICGSMAMKWGAYASRSRYRAKLSEPAVPITFWGCSVGNLVVALAGSYESVVGKQGRGSASSAALTDSLTYWLLENMGESYSYGSAGPRLAPRLTLDSYDIANAVWLAVGQHNGRPRNFEFVAKVLHRSEWPHGFRSSFTQKIILGTPLYVADTAQLTG